MMTMYIIGIIIGAIIGWFFGYAEGKSIGATKERIALTGSSMPKMKNPPPPPHRPITGYQLSNSMEVEIIGAFITYARLDFLQNNAIVKWKHKARVNDDRGNSNIYEKGRL